MDANKVPVERTSWDLLLFGVACIGILIAVVGVISTNPPVALAGVLVTFIGLLFFLLKQ